MQLKRGVTPQSVGEERSNLYATDSSAGVCQCVFVPLLNQESLELCILSWCVVLGAAALQMFMLRKFRGSRKAWIPAILGAVVLVVTEVAAQILLLMGSWLLFLVFLLDVFELYFMAGLLLGILVDAGIRYFARKRQ